MELITIFTDEVELLMVPSYKFAVIPPIFASPEATDCPVKVPDTVQLSMDFKIE